jgi:hypothetical protein
MPKEREGENGQGENRDDKQIVDDAKSQGVATQKWCA